MLHLSRGRATLSKSLLGYRFKISMVGVAEGTVWKTSQRRADRAETRLPTYFRKNSELQECYCGSFCSTISAGDERTPEAVMAGRSKSLMTKQGETAGMWKFVDGSLQLRGVAAVPQVATRNRMTSHKGRINDC